MEDRKIQAKQLQDLILFLSEGCSKTSLVPDFLKIHFLDQFLFASNGVVETYATNSLGLEGFCIDADVLASLVRTIDPSETVFLSVDESKDRLFVSLSDNDFGSLPIEKSLSNKESLFGECFDTHSLTCLELVKSQGTKTILADTDSLLRYFEQLVWFSGKPEWGLGLDFVCFDFDQDFFLASDGYRALLIKGTSQFWKNEVEVRKIFVPRSLIKSLRTIPTLSFVKLMDDRIVFEGLDGDLKFFRGSRLVEAKQDIINIVLDKFEMKQELVDLSPSIFSKLTDAFARVKVFIDREDLILFKFGSEQFVLQTVDSLSGEWKVIINLDQQVKSCDIILKCWVIDDLFRLVDKNHPVRLFVNEDLSLFYFSQGDCMYGVMGTCLT